MKNNKKGFTLIELLAVIVILAIIMVIAVPQILGVIEDSRKSAWKDNVQMIEKALDLNSTLVDPTTGAKKLDITSICPATETDVTETLSTTKNLVDLDSTTVKCSTASGKSTFTITGAANSQFAGGAAALECTSSSCNTTAITWDGTSIK